MGRTFRACMCMYNICIYCIPYVYHVYIFSADPGTGCWQPCEPGSSTSFPSSSLLSIYLVHNSSACLEGGSDVKGCPKPCWSQDKHPWLSPHPLSKSPPCRRLPAWFSLHTFVPFGEVPTLLDFSERVRASPAILSSHYFCIRVHTLEVGPFSLILPTMKSFLYMSAHTLRLPLEPTMPSLGSRLSSPFPHSLRLKLSSHRIPLNTCNYGQVKQSNSDLLLKILLGKREKKKVLPEWKSRDPRSALKHVILD